LRRTVVKFLGAI